MGSLPLLYAARVAGPRNPEVLNALARLMDALDNPGELSDDDLIALHGKMRSTARRGDRVIAAELARRGWSWRKIGAALDVHFTTAHGWVEDAGLLPTVEEARRKRQAGLEVDVGEIEEQSGVDVGETYETGYEIDED